MKSRVKRFLSNHNVLNEVDRLGTEKRMQRTRLFIFLGLLIYEVFFGLRRPYLPGEIQLFRAGYLSLILLYLPAMPILAGIFHKRHKAIPATLLHAFFAIDILLISGLALVHPIELPRTVVLYLFIPPFILLPSLPLLASLSITAGFTGSLGYGAVLFYLAASGQLPKDPAWLFLFILAAGMLFMQGIIIASLIDSNRMRYLRVLGYQRMLRRQRDRLEGAKTSQQDFFAGMSHELRTPLNGILGMAGLIIDSYPTGDQEEYARGIQNNAEALLTIINNILDLSKIEAGRLTPESRPFDLGKTVELVLQTVEHTASGVDIQVTAKIEPRVPRFIVGDQGRLMQILYNLMGNGVKFTSKGTVALHVGLQSAETNLPPALSFTISDTGPGIPPGQLNHIFEKYSQFQGDSNAELSKKGQRGTGLGLAITRELVQLLGGQISVESAIGVGSTFTVVLPIHDAPIPSRMADGQPELFSLGAETSLAVLIVDDNPGNRRILERMVLRFGAQPSIAASGKDALAMFEKQHFDLAIIDYQMPGYSGLETAARIRRIEAEQNRPPVLLYLLSGHDPSQFQEDGKPDLSRIAGVLQKPIRIEGVRELIREARSWKSGKR